MSPYVQYQQHRLQTNYSIFLHGTVYTKRPRRNLRRGRFDIELKTKKQLAKNGLHISFDSRDRSDVEVLNQEIENIRGDEGRQ